jgi:hypothetical protein
VTTTLAIIVAFFPARQITSLWKYEVTMFGITLGFIALAVFFFYVYGHLKEARAAAVEQKNLGAACQAKPGDC